MSASGPSGPLVFSLSYTWLSIAKVFVVGFLTAMARTLELKAWSAG